MINYIILLNITNIMDLYNENKVLTFTEGAYEIKHINEIIQDRIIDSNNPSNIPIQIKVNHGSGRCEITLKPGYKIDFTKDDTFRNILGFDIQ